jgi:hypothetical protein
MRCADWRLERTVVPARRTSIGSGAIIMCGVEIPTVQW